ncbi:MAG: ECF transporter S component [Synergistetes bacterium]|nr:ECF transporter S component [Synergistota bacterium]
MVLKPYEKRGEDMQQQTRNVAIMATFTALTTLATFVYFPIPSTKIYFNLGEAIIYLVSLSFQPAIASLSAGIGSSLADLLLGYPLWAPFTFAIKFSEAITISYLASRRLPSSTSERIKIIIPGAVIMIAGYAFATYILYGAKVVPWEIITDIGQCSAGGAIALILSDVFLKVKNRIT